MPESTMDQILAELRTSAAQHYPGMGELRNLRIVGHTPKSDHFIYDVVLDFDSGSRRLAAKVYRSARERQSAMAVAAAENDNLRHVHAIFTKKNMAGIPRPIGDFSKFGAVVTEKAQGAPLQSIIMKGALLPGYAENGALQLAATQAGHWLRNFHRATADMPTPFEPGKLLVDLEQLCASCKGEGLDDTAIKTILAGAKKTLNTHRKNLPVSAVLNDFTPLNVIVGENGIGIAEFANMKKRGTSLHDVAHFLAAIEALEKYPFCNRAITARLQESFLEAYGLSASEAAVLRVLKMRELLQMFAQGRVGAKESAVRKKVMWANVMKRFIQQAAHRSLAPAA